MVKVLPIATKSLGLQKLPERSLPLICKSKCGFLPMRQLDKFSNFISTYKIMVKHPFDGGQSPGFLWIISLIPYTELLYKSLLAVKVMFFLLTKTPDVSPAPPEVLEGKPTLCRARPDGLAASTASVEQTPPPDSLF